MNIMFTIVITQWVKLHENNFFLNTSAITNNIPANKTKYNNNDNL